MKSNLLKYPYLIIFVFFGASASLTAQCALANNIYTFVYNGKSYEVVRENKTWSAAAACALAKGGQLAEINDATEQTALFTELANAGITNSNTVAPDGGGGSYVWLGGNDLAVEGNWIWDGDNLNGGPQFWMGTSTGSPVGGLYNNWGNEPDNFGGQDALGLSLNGWPLGVAGEWNDVDHLNTLYYIIEHPGILCTPTSSTISPVACSSYTSPSGQIWTTSRTYSDTILNAAGCDSVITINLTINNVDTSVSVAGTQLTANANNAKYQWYDCSTQTILLGDTSQQLTVSANGSYAVIITQNGCTDTSACVSYTDIGVPNYALNAIPSIFPNPNKGRFTVLNPSHSDSAIEIYNAAGNLVYANKISEATIALDIDLSPGLYLIHIFTKDNVQKGRMLVK